LGEEVRLLLYVQMSMAATPSTMTELGRKAPPFALPNVLTGETVSLGDFEGRKALLVMFICKHCPYVLHVKPALIQLAMDYVDRPLGIVSISSTMRNVTDDAPERIAEMALKLFPLLYDETQEVANTARRALPTSSCSMSIGLAYRGQMDDSRPGATGR
jgi:peroxiredoxin